jgi:hypothetical protein
MLRRRRTGWWLWTILLGAGLAWTGCSMVEDYKARKAAGQDPEIAQLEQSRAELLALLPELTAHFGADDPSVQAVQYEVAQIEEMIELRRQMLRRQTQADRRVRRSMPRL